MYTNLFAPLVSCLVTIASADLPPTNSPVASVASGFSLSKEPRSIAHWPSQPTVVICKNAPTSTGAVESAVSWWRSLGYRFWMTVPDSIHYGCLMGNPEGNILIKLIDNRGVNPNNLATSYIYYNEDSGEILWAEILLREEPRERVLEHEIGHALGWLHYPKKNHIMHPEWVKSGWDQSGLRK